MSNTLYMGNTLFMGNTLYIIQGISFIVVLPYTNCIHCIFYLFICFLNKTSVNGPLLAINACVSILFSYNSFNNTFVADVLRL